MPNRILKESICTSENVDQLSAFEETVFYRLIVNCDDYGRMDGRPKILISKLFPLKEVRVKQMEDALRALTSAELVTLYTVDGKPFLQMKTWDKHQQMRAKKSKYPAPADGVPSLDINCNQMISSDSKCSRNPIQSESETETESETESNPKPTRPRDAVDMAFAMFWDAYPRKIGKGAAYKAFERITGVPIMTMIDAIESQKRSRQWREDNGRFIPNPATWLNQRRWEDDPQNENSSTGNAFADLVREGVFEDEKD